MIANAAENGATMKTQYATPLLDAAIEREKKEREELRKLLLGKVFDVLALMNKAFPFQEAYIFGSISKPFNFTERSDVDIAFVGLDDKHFFQAMSFLSGELGVSVDIVQLENHRLAEKIRKEGIKWIKSDFPS